MLPLPYGGVMVTIERPNYNRFNDVVDYSTHTIDGCLEYPAATSEQAPNVGIRDMRGLLLPPGSDIQAIDRVVIHEPGSVTPPTNAAERRARTYSVVGHPKEWVHAMTGWAPGISAELERVS